jgi:hypothetical protein
MRQAEGKEQGMITLGKRQKIGLGVVFGALTLYALVGFIAVPLVVEHILATTVSQALKRQVTTAGVRFNPFTLSLRVKGLSVAESDGVDFIKAAELRINLELISIFKKALVVKSVSVNEPQLRVVRLTADRFNFSDLLIASPDKSAAPAGPSPRAIVERLRIDAGRLFLSDRSNPEPFETQLSSLTIALDGLDTQPKAKPAQVKLGVRSEAGETIEAQGRIGIEPLTADLTVGLKAIAMPKYRPYYQTYLNGALSSGSVELQAMVSYTAERITASKIRFKIGDLAVNSKGREIPVIKLPLVQMEDAAIDLTGRKIDGGRILSRDGQIVVVREKEGALNLLQLAVPPSKNGAESSTEESSAAWRVTVPELTLENYALNVEDLSTDPAALLSVDQLALGMKNFDMTPGSVSPLTLSLRWAGKGSLALEGTVGIDPLTVDLQLAAQDLDIRPAQPYIAQQAQLVVTTGEVNAKGALRIFGASGADPDLRYSGQVALNNFQSVDAHKADDFLKFKSLYLNGLELGTTPVRVKVEEVALTDFFHRLIIFPDGTMNLANVLTAPNKTDAPAKPVAGHSQAPAPDLRIETITLQGGQVDFSDLQVLPNVKMQMSKLGGRVSGLTALRERKADVLLRGKVGQNVPLEIAGKVNPLIAPPFVDLKMSIDGVDLSPFSPYADKYVGYNLDKGQLSLKLAYLVNENKLNAQNKIFLDQLTLGKAVESPTATKLPVKLAIALLKDRQGNIDLDLPITGNLDEPEFSMGGLILRMLSNLIISIVSSPFKALGALFGGGEELAYLDFGPGEPAVSPEYSAKAESLSKILFERPGLNMEIQGQADIEIDGDGLRRLRFEQSIKAAKLKALMAKGQKAVPLEEIAVSPEERAGFIQRAFDAATFPKPRDEKGELKKLEIEEKEKLLFTSIEVTMDDLRQLAWDRSGNAKDFLVQQGKIDPGRLFIVEPRVEKRDLKDPNAAKLHRVQFNMT